MTYKTFSTKTGMPLNKFQETGYKQIKNTNYEQPLDNYINYKRSAVDYIDNRGTAAAEDLSRHFSKHEAECEVCDYIETFRNLDKEKFKEMFVFSEVIGKPVSMRKGKR